ncbi:MAG: response regulator [Treponema sp.]|nr:response regulator [Treponema sp.]MCL2250411.1 response regulator [Treponema sp.]
MKKILLIDDSLFHLTVAEDILKNKYEITTAKSAKEALGYLSNKRLVPNLIILDILMPDIDGWETYNLIKGISLLRDVPIAFLTSLDGDAEKDEAAKLGAADFITKPFEEGELIKRIEAIIGKHEAKDDS